jgi:hypothetical protein
MAYLADKETELSNAFVSEGNGDREGDGVNTASSPRPKTVISKLIHMRHRTTTKYSTVYETLNWAL